MQPQFLHSNLCLFLFDLVLRQSIHNLKLPAQISDKSCLKRDLNFAGVVTFIHYKMIYLDSITSENNKKHNEKWPFIPDHPC